MDKKCSVCKHIKPLSEFHKDSARKDGLSVRCKSCAIENARAYYAKHREKYLAYSREQRASEKHKALKRKYAERYPEKASAHYQVNKAVATNQMVHIRERQCEACGRPAEHYHHPDYSKPLDVIPLCESCHRRIHGAGL